MGKTSTIRGKTERNSAVELLRLISISGIICMHIYGHVTEGLIDLAGYAFVNTIFNCGVSVFILISGFYGIKSTIPGGVRLVLTTIVYSVLSYIVISTNGGVISLKELVRSMLPVSAGKYWFMSAYFILFCFANLFNKALESMERKQHTYLILGMSVIFVLAPTITFLHIMGDGGKGICNMLLMYVIGRYIGKYYDRISNRHYLLYVGLLLVVGTIANFITGYLVPRDGVPYAPLAKDSSVITVLLSIAIFMVVIRHDFKSKAINRVAKHTIAIYLLESAIEGYVLDITGLWTFKGNWYYIFLLFLCAGGISLFCCAIDEVRMILFIPVERLMRRYEDDIRENAVKIADKIVEKM